MRKQQQGHNAYNELTVYLTLSTEWISNSVGVVVRHLLETISQCGAVFEVLTKKGYRRRGGCKTLASIIVLTVSSSGRDTSSSALPAIRTPAVVVFQQ